MKKGRPAEPARGDRIKTVSKLQSQLAGRILAYIRAGELAPGTHLAELDLCERFKVSRSPVRGALSLLQRRGYIEHIRNRGFFTLAAAAVEENPGGLPETALEPEKDQLYLTIAEDRIARQLPEQISEADLARRYGASKGELRRALQRLLREGLVERLPGRGWAFAPVLDSKETHDESYRFRLTIEPQCLLEPGFKLDENAARQCELKHRRILDGTVKEVSAIELFDMNAEFHELIAASSGNRFFLQAIQQQNRLRRFVNYHWTYGPERVMATCREHMSVLDAIRSGDMIWAASLLRRHLEISSTVSPYEGQSGPDSNRTLQHVIQLP